MTAYMENGDPVLADVYSDRAARIPGCLNIGYIVLPNTLGEVCVIHGSADLWEQVGEEDSALVITARMAGALGYTIKSQD